MRAKETKARRLDGRGRGQKGRGGVESVEARGGESGEGGEKGRGWGKERDCG